MGPIALTWVFCHKLVKIHLVIFLDIVIFMFCAIFSNSRWQPSRLAAVVFVSLLHISCIFAFFFHLPLQSNSVSVAEQKRLATIVEAVKHDTLSQASMML